MGIPVANCFVRRNDGDPSRAGRVISKAEDPSRIPIDWGAGKTTVEIADDLVPAFAPGWRVHHQPQGAGQTSRGSGTALGTRTLAGRGQILVQFDTDGIARWMDYEPFARFPEVPALFERRRVRDRVLDAERFVLKTSAYALSTWNDTTGSFSRIDIDPLPHQIFVAHHMARAGHFNFLLADDVGLGKTVEVGLAIKVLEGRVAEPRVLIVCPAGLVLQWQNEMRDKFGRNYVIHGEGFRPSQPWEWKLQNRVIASIDTLKPRDADGGRTHFEILMAAASWDIVIFDEGHKLTRDDDGEASLRFRLAESLRTLTRNLLIATATPHDGNTGRFRSLLALVRPDLQRQIDRIQFDPSVISQIVLRNRKSDVTDAMGEFIFQGHSVRRVEVASSLEAETLDRALREYIAEVYTGTIQEGAAVRRAVGFVLATYRKLAASSPYALARAMERRIARIEGIAGPVAESRFGEEDSADATIDAAGSNPFFSAEKVALRDLVELADSAALNDHKARDFLAQVELFSDSGRNKLLIFTEFRDTLAFLEERLLGAGLTVAVLKGGMTAEEKKDAIHRFENVADLMLSTEAGAEGFNLHENCHVEVNYDLPWNPVKLIQRIGRLYRYGQKKRVAVINLQDSRSIDSQVVGYAYRRVENIVREMADVSGEYLDNYAAEVLGDLLGHLDIEAIVEAAGSERIERSRERIDDALDKARSAALMQQEILATATGFDNAFFDTLRNFSTADVARFVRRMAPLSEYEVDESLTGERLRIRLSDGMKGRFPEFGSRTLIEATTDREYSRRHPTIMLLDFESAFVREIVAEAKSPSFGGFYAEVSSPAVVSGEMAAFLVRWQDESGEPAGEEIVVVHRGSNGISVDTSTVTRLLQESDSALPDEVLCVGDFQTLRETVANRIRTMSSSSRVPSMIVDLTACRIVNPVEARAAA
ncbi:helicase-related protein [Aurantimonas litoralis]|nr:helicase-related protein [Aurantimonas litoralis]